MGGTLFAAIYNRFLSKITDDLYIELTPEDTLKDLQNLILDSIPGFEFPRVNLYDYTIKTEELLEDEITPDDFVLGPVWHNTDWAGDEDGDLLNIPTHVIVDRSSFAADLTAEE